MQPKIIESRQITLAGMSFYGDPFDTHSGWDEDNQIGLLWKRLFAYLGKEGSLKDLLQSKNWYEVHVYSEWTQTKGLFEVFVGVECEHERIADLPPQLLVKNLPETKYAVFTFQGEEISADWEKLLGDWMVSAEFESGGTYNFQFYDERFKGLDKLEESELDVYIPIKKKID